MLLKGFLFCFLFEQKMEEICLQKPFLEQCRQFQIPEANVSLALDNLCSMMNWMPGCAVRRLCSFSSNIAMDRKICEPFSILADICAKDMPRMKGCSIYTQICQPGSVVDQCTQYPPLPFLPTTRESRDYVNSICNEMDMDGCELCVNIANIKAIRSAKDVPKPCDAFTVYASLCLVMPGMDQVCSSYIVTVNLYH